MTSFSGCCSERASRGFFFKLTRDEFMQDAGYQGLIGKAVNKKMRLTKVHYCSILIEQ